MIWQPHEGLTFSQLERHFAVTQTFIQLSGPPAVVAVAEPTDLDDPEAAPDPSDVHAFLIDPAKGFSLKRGTWHSLNRYILAPPGSTFVTMNSRPNPHPDCGTMRRTTASPIRDLRSDKNPTKVDFKGKYGVVLK